MRDDKSSVYLVLLALLILIFYFIFNLTGLIITETRSEVSIDEGIIIIYDGFSGFTTDFLRMNDLELQAVENLALENFYGKISFSEIVNLTVDVVNNTLNLDELVTIEKNHILINLEKLTSFNQPATLYLYNLNFNQPRILRNGELCSDCKIIRYNRSVIVFNVSSPDDYSVEETPIVAPEETEESESSGGGGGGGFGFPTTAPASFEATTDFIPVTIITGETKEYYLSIKNTGKADLNLSLNIENLQGILSLNEEFVFIKAGETKELKLNVYGIDSPAVHIGKLTISYGKIEKTVSVVVEIKDPEALFDLKVEIENRLKRFYAGDEIPLLIGVKNIGLSGESVDVELYTSIVDLDRNVLFEYSKEVVAVKDNLTIEKEVKIPDSLKNGKYLLLQQLMFGEMKVESFETFDVVDKREKIWYWVLYVTAGVVLIFVIMKLINWVSTELSILRMRNELKKKKGEKRIK